LRIGERIGIEHDYRWIATKPGAGESVDTEESTTMLSHEVPREQILGAEVMAQANRKVNER
jgi:hypothetical protein